MNYLLLITYAMFVKITYDKMHYKKLKKNIKVILNHFLHRVICITLVKAIVFNKSPIRHYSLDIVPFAFANTARHLQSGARTITSACAGSMQLVSDCTSSCNSGTVRVTGFPFESLSKTLMSCLLAPNVWHPYSNRNW